MSFYIGLSFLSNKGRGRRVRQELLSAEGRNILSVLEGRHLKDDEVSIEKNGRPFFSDRAGDFSISHSGAMTAVSLVKGTTLRTGCDIQIVRPNVSVKEIAEKFFTAHERDYICGDLNRFFEIWALKECFLKLRGLSVFDMESVPSFIDSSGCGFAFNADVTLPLSFFLYELVNANERYFLAAALEGSAFKGGELRPEIRWVSQSFLPCMSIAEINAALSPESTVSPKI